MFPRSFIIPLKEMINFWKRSENKVNQEGTTVSPEKQPSKYERNVIHFYCDNFVNHPSANACKKIKGSLGKTLKSTIVVR